MVEIINTLKNSLVNFASNENYINIIGIIVVAITTYRVTKYSVLNPYRLKIKQQQLEYVYLPLFRLFSDMPQDISKTSALSFYEKISNILDKHYVLAFPQLHRLTLALKTDILKDLDYIKTIYSLKHQVDIDYELLKKSLGYPSENFYSLFVRMTPKQKYLCLSPLIDSLWILVPCFITFPLLKILGIYSIFIFIPITLICGFILRKLNKFANSLKD